VNLSDKEKEVLSLIDVPEYHAYFFEKAKDIKWFYLLKNDKDCFNPKKIAFNKNGSALFWNPLFYLERVSQQMTYNQELSVKYGPELIGIINNLVHFSRTKKRVKNHHIWWYCVKILNNIPNIIIAQHLPVDSGLVEGKNKLGFKIWINEFLDPSQSSILAISNISESLLPKFFNDPSMIPYAEAIIEAITRIKPSGKKNAFTKEDEADLIWDEHWISKAFQKYGKEIGAKCPNAVHIIADRLRLALEYKRNEYYVVLNIKGKLYQLKVARIRKDGLKPNEIAFKPNEFQGIILQYTDKQLEGIDVDKDYWKFSRIEPEIKKHEFFFSATEHQSFIKGFKEGLPADVEWPQSEDYDHKINGLFGGLNEDYSSVWCKSLISGPDHDRGTEEVLAIALRDVLLGKCETEDNQAIPILKEFLSQKYPFPIFKKCVLVCIYKSWNSFGRLFKDFLQALPSSLHASAYEVEIYDILANLSKYPADPELNDMLKTFISKVPDYYVKEGPAAESYWKYKWFSPLKDHPAFSALYQEFKEKAKLQEDKPYEPVRRSVMTGWVKHQSPLTKEEILKKENVELVAFLNEYKGADEWSGSFEGKPDKEGLKDALQEAAKEKPDKFYKDLFLFGKCHYDYVSRILWGLQDAWVGGTDIDWSGFFDFCIDYLKRKDFIRQAEQAQGDDFGKGRYLWVIDIMVGLIESGSRNDERAFSPEFFIKVDKIYDLIYDIVIGEKHPDTQRDAMTYAINTTLGKTIESFIIYSLRVARVEKKTEGRWDSSKYERFFDKGIEAYIFLGRYLPQINYLDKDYVKQKIDDLGGRKADDFEWQMFMEGYLTGPNVYEDLYKLMRSHYMKAVENKVLEDRVDERLVQHIAIGYLRGYEELKPRCGNDDLFWKLLHEASTKEKQGRWKDVVDFLWSVAGRSTRRERSEDEKPSEEFKKRILGFWAWAHSPSSFAKEKLGEKYEEFLGSLAQFTVLLKEIDDVTEKWLLASAQYLKGPLADTYFIEYLNQFEDANSIKRIGKIFKKILEVSTPMYRQEDIQEIVQKIYAKGIYEDAEDICHTYGRRGIHFLKETWTKNQK
jgi:hypothetical protein